MQKGEKNLTRTGKIGYRKGEKNLTRIGKMF